MGRYEARATVDWQGFGGSVESASGMLATSTAAQVELFNHSVNLQTLTNMSTIGANNTIGLMNAYSGMS